eukprot:5427141-Prorocentrum_lima.AAC.1
MIAACEEFCSVPMPNKKYTFHDYVPPVKAAVLITHRSKASWVVPIKASSQYRFRINDLSRIKK